MPPVISLSLPTKLQIGLALMSVTVAVIGAIILPVSLSAPMPPPAGPAGSAEPIQTAETALAGTVE